MKTMILDTSSANLFVSFVVDGQEIYKRVIKTVNNHSEVFLDTIKEGLDETNLKVGDFSKIIVGIGPGSYTGLRVSLTVAKTFAWTKDIPLYTVNSLYILGSGYFNTDGKYAILNVAKKNHYYYQLLECSNGEVKETIPAGFKSFEDYHDLMKDYSDYQEITVNDYSYSGLNITKLNNLNKVEDIHGLVPDYLRKEI